jgi:hypothetical protein
MRIAYVLLTAVIASTGCEGLGGSCMTVEQHGPGMAGMASYVLGDGTKLTKDLDNVPNADITGDGIELYMTFEDEWGIRRAATLHLGVTEVGTYELAGRADVCIVRQSGGDEVCAPLEGTLELRAFEHDCYTHSSGIGTCAETLDFTLVARSEWQGTLFTIDGTMNTVGEWVEAECDD